MGNNNKSNQIDRTFGNASPSNKKNGAYHQQQHGSQRPSPSKSINIKTPNKNYSSNAGYSKQQPNGTRLSGSCSPNSSYFAGSKCFDSPRPSDLPKPPSSWFAENVVQNYYQAADDAGRTVQSNTSVIVADNRRSMARKSLNLENSCATEYAKAMQYSSFSNIDFDDHYTQNLKLLLNVNA